MKILHFIVFFLVSIPAIAEDNPFVTFDNFGYYKDRFENMYEDKNSVIVDGKLSDTCISVSKSFEKVLNEKGNNAVEKLELVKILKPSLSFIELCLREGLLKK